MKLAVGSRPLDNLLGGGVESGILTEFYGEAGTGKTNICLQLTRNCAANGGRVAYIDSEGVSIERLEQICSDIPVEEVLRRMALYQPRSLSEQEQMAGKASRMDVGLIVLDTVNMYYRLGLIDGEDEAERSLLRQLVGLQMAARDKDVPVVITAQVYTSGPDPGDVEPFAGRSMEHIVKATIKLEKAGGLRKGRRRASIIKHRSQPEGASAEFVIASHGLE